MASRIRVILLIRLRLPPPARVYKVIAKAHNCTWGFSLKIRRPSGGANQERITCEADLKDGNLEDYPREKGVSLMPRTNSRSKHEPCAHDRREWGMPAAPNAVEIAGLRNQ